MENKLLEIINLVLENKDIPLISSLNLSDDLRNDLGFDSFDLAELTVRIEDEFDVDVFSNGLINTVGQIVEQLKK
jgi:acyl carrier protein